MSCGPQRQEGRPQDRRSQWLRLLRPLHLFPDPAAHHIPSSLLMASSLAFNPEFAQDPIISKGFHIVHPLRCLQSSDKRLDGCFGSHHTAEEAEGWPRVRVSLWPSRSGKSWAPSPVWDMGSPAPVSPAIRGPETPTLLFLLCSPIPHQAKILEGRGLSCLTNP